MDKLSEEIKNFGMNIAKQVDERLNNFSTSQENLIKNQIKETYASFEQSLNFNFNEITSKAKDDLKKHTTKLLEAINDQLFKYKRNIIYCQLDLLRIISPNIKPNKDHLKFLVRSFKLNFQIEINIETLITYVDQNYVH
jgi:hypothetical protein